MFHALARLLGRVFRRRGGRPLVDRLLESQRVAGLGSWEWDTVTNRVWWSPEQYRLYGLSPATFTPTPETCLAVVLPADRPAIMRAVESVMAGGTQLAWDYRVLRADGAVMWFQSRWVATRDAAGTVVRLSGTDQPITERKQAEDALRASEERFRAIFDQTFQFTGLLATDGTVLEVNVAALAAGGLAARDVLGKPFWETAWWPRDADQQGRLRDAVTRAAAGDAVRFEATYAAAGGEANWVDFSVKPFRDRDGVIRWLIPEGRDITEAKRAEAALREGEARLALTLQAAGAATWFLDLDGMKFMPSETAVQMHGLPAGTALDSAGAMACVHPEDRPRVQAALAATLADGRPYRVEYRVTAGAGDRWLASSGELHGQRLLGLLQDITDRKRAEAALRESEAMYRSVVDSLAEGIVVQDAAGVIVTCNGRAETILGLTRDQIAGRTSMDPRWRAVRADGAPFPGADHPAAVTLRTGEPVFNTVMGVRKPDGGEAWITVNAVPVREPAPPGAVAAVVCSFHDVTAARRMDEQLRASLREKEVMLREIHHRVKNNLAVTVGLFNFQMRTMTDGSAKAALRQAQDRVRTMALVHEMLHQAAMLTELDLPGYVGQLVRHLAAGYAAGNQVAVTLDVAPVALPLEAAIPFGLILNELVSNAFKHAFPDARAGALAITLRHAGNELTLEVRDDGPGPPPGADPFEAKSTGLQLVRELAGQLDGRMAWEQAGGTVFRLTFPAGGGPGARRR